MSDVNEQMPPWLVQARASIGRPEDVERIVDEILGVVRKTLATLKAGVPPAVRGEMVGAMGDAILLLGMGSSQPGDELVIGLPEHERDQFDAMLNEPRPRWAPGPLRMLPSTPLPPRIELTPAMRRLWDGLWDAGLIDKGWAGGEVITVGEPSP